jgi:hypothetical protein
MKKYLATILVLIGSFGIGAVPAYADLQCYAPPYTTGLNVQSARQCASVDLQARLFDTSTNSWTNPSTGAQTYQPGFSCVGLAPAYRTSEPTPTGECTVGYKLGKVTYDSSGAISRVDYKDGSVETPTSYSLTGSTVGPTPTATTQTKQPGGNIQYTPLEPIPGINTSSTDVPKFLQAMYGILISLGGVVAVGLIVWGGIVYMTSEIADKKTSARKRIQGAFWGLLLLISSYLAINTINPQLLEFRFLNSIGGTGAANATTNPEITNLQKITNADISDCENVGKHLVTQSDGSWICK